MVRKSWTDEEILGIIQSNAPSHVIQRAWDTLIGKYQDELEAEALKLWGDDDFLVSDTVDQALITARAWIQAYDDIDAVNDNFRQWLHSILYQQFSRDSGIALSDRNGQLPSLKDDDWFERETPLLASDRLTVFDADD